MIEISEITHYTIRSRIKKHLKTAVAGTIQFPDSKQSVSRYYVNEYFRIQRKHFPTQTVYTRKRKYKNFKSLLAH